jgi:hypothetical protein
MDAVATSPEMLAADRDWVRSLWSALRPFAPHEGSYVTFMAEYEQDRVRARYGNKYERLARVKQPTTRTTCSTATRTYDPRSPFSDETRTSEACFHNPHGGCAAADWFTRWCWPPLYDIVHEEGRWRRRVGGPSTRTAGRRRTKRCSRAPRRIAGAAPRQRATFRHASGTASACSDEKSWGRLPHECVLVALSVTGFSAPT